MKIGLVSNLSDELFRNKLEQKKYKIKQINERSLDKELLELDGVVITSIEKDEEILNWITEIRKYSEVFVWICQTGEKEKMSSLLYLHSGADGVFSEKDYDELILVMDRVFMRKLKEANYAKNTNIRLVPESLCLKIGVNSVYLTKKEYALLSELLDEPDEVKGYDYLLKELFGETRNKTGKPQLATLALYLRRKLCDYSDYIEVCTVRGQGFKLNLYGNR